MLSDLEYYQYLRTEMIQFLPKEYKKVLEIGCAEGVFSGNLNPNSEIWGIELDEKSAEIAKKKMKYVLVGKYNQLYSELPENYFDLVICNDVIEHMEDHNFFFSSIKERIRVNGFLVASIPNVRHYKNLYELLIEKDWRYRDGGILDRTHLRFFTEKSIKRTLSKHGFVIERFLGIHKPKSLIILILLLIISIVSIGYYGDLQYLQFGLSARKKY